MSMCALRSAMVRRSGAPTSQRRTSDFRTSHGDTKSVLTRHRRHGRARALFIKPSLVERVVLSSGVELRLVAGAMTLRLRRSDREQSFLEILSSHLTVGERCSGLL